ncbi:hypothetical protein CF326_g7324 [Tilletia indica]|nr:hypothetical protein CF326_g7324 [Tilletia indica]
MSASGPAQGSSSAEQMAAMKEQVKKQLETRKDREIKLNIGNPGSPHDSDRGLKGQSLPQTLVTFERKSVYAST